MLSLDSMIVIAKRFVMGLAVNEIHLGDARDLLPQIDSGSIACSVWSPPYHLNKEYEKGETYGIRSPMADSIQVRLEGVWEFWGYELLFSNRSGGRHTLTSTAFSV
jgi:DNA modification methylase